MSEDVTIKLSPQEASDLANILFFKENFQLLLVDKVLSQIGKQCKIESLKDYAQNSHAITIDLPRVMEKVHLYALSHANAFMQHAQKLAEGK